MFRRWLRCLFTHEFHLEDVMVLWDAVFGDDDPSEAFDLVDYISVAMHLLKGIGDAKLLEV